MTTLADLRLPALEVQQTARRCLYSFAVDGKLLHTFAAIARIRRDESEQLLGYQRPEVRSHIGSIRHYLESSDPMLPNAIVLAFDTRVRFEPASHSSPQASFVRQGELVIPVTPHCEPEEMPGWIVDGQQRAAALRDASVNTFPVCVSAFITDEDAEQRAQFILVNSTKPLPKGLVYELLPETTATLPRHLRFRKFPAYLLQRLNQNRQSPLRYLINTPTIPEGVIKDNSMLKMLENTLTDGALYHLRDPETGTGDVDAILTILKNYWAAVREVFPDAWGLPPRRSRLMHGAGIVSMGFIMDAICDRFLPNRYPTLEEFAEDLTEIAPICRWTSGYWEFRPVQRRWNELQNTPKDIQLLADFLLTEYRERILGQRRLRLAAT